jgi:hypothetical protein
MAIISAQLTPQRFILSCSNRSLGSLAATAHISSF